MTTVLVDATALPADRGGVGRYVDELVTRLPGLGAEVHVAAQERDLTRYAAVLDADHVHLAPGWASGTPARLVWEQVGLPGVVRQLRPDVLHSPHYTMPLPTRLAARLRGPVELRRGIVAAANHGEHVPSSGIDGDQCGLDTLAGKPDESVADGLFSGALERGIKRRVHRPAARREAAR